MTTIVTIKHDRQKNLLYSTWTNPRVPGHQETIEFSAQRVRQMLTQQRVQHLADGRVRIASQQGIVLLSQSALAAL